MFTSSSTRVISKLSKAEHGFCGSELPTCLCMLVYQSTILLRVAVAACATAGGFEDQPWSHRTCHRWGVLGLHVVAGLAKKASFWADTWLPLL